MLSVQIKEPSNQRNAEAEVVVVPIRKTNANLCARFVCFSVSEGGSM